MSDSNRIHGGAARSLKFLQNVNEDQIYYYMGHGLTPCSPYGVPQHFKLEDNVSLITASKCGINTVASRKTEEDTITTFRVDSIQKAMELDREYTIDATGTILKKQKTLYFSRGSKEQSRDFQIILPSEWATDITFQAAKNFQSKDKPYFIYPAGLQKLSTLWKIFDYSEFMQNSKRKLISGLADIVTAGDFTFGYALYKMYGLSEQPGWPLVKNLMTDFFTTRYGSSQMLDEIITDKNVEIMNEIQDYLADKLQIRVSKLMKKFQGVHIWNSCRALSPSCFQDLETYQKYEKYL